VNEHLTPGTRAAEFTPTELQTIADALDLLVAIDEGEHVDVDELIALRDRILTRRGRTRLRRATVTFGPTPAFRKLCDRLNTGGVYIIEAGGHVIRIGKAGDRPNSAATIGARLRLFMSVGGRTPTNTGERAFFKALHGHELTIRWWPITDKDAIHAFETKQRERVQAATAGREPLWEHLRPLNRYKPDDLCDTVTRTIKAWQRG
jgi:hypothetical protein